MSLEATKAVVKELQKLHRGSLVELYSLDLTMLGVDSVLNFHNGAGGDSQPIAFLGVSYIPLPIAVRGFEFSGAGEPPRPSLSISNIGGFMTGLILQTNDLVGARLTRRRTFTKYLDGQPEAGNFQLPEDVFYVEQKTNETDLRVDFELGSGLDLDGKSFPTRQVVASHCRVDHYRGEGCYFARGFCVQDDKSATFPGADKFIGDFQELFAYQVGDAIGFTKDGYYQMFVNIVAISATAHFQSPLHEPTKWEMVQRNRGAFDSTVAYSTKDVVFVEYEDYRAYYYAKRSVPAGQRPPNSIYWTSDQCVKTLAAGCSLHFDPRRRGYPLNFNGFPGTQSLPEI
jgi:lambda family phage minor tail protein L